MNVWLKCRFAAWIFRGIAPVGLFACLTLRASAAEPDFLSKLAPPWPRPGGEVLRVSTVDQLFGAIERLTPGTAILIEDGEYELSRPLVLNAQTNIALRSASGDPGAVTLRGKGWEAAERGADLVHIGRCQGVTIADLTFAEARSYGIKVEAENAPRDIHIYNCRFRNIGVRAIKGSASQDPATYAAGGSIRYCEFENTRIPPADWLFGGDYIAAIDMMALDGWTISDNRFRAIKGRRGGARAAIFVWVRSRNVAVERNFIIDCDRGIAFGNPGQSTANQAGEPLVYVADSVIRNNIIAGGADCGIELWHVRGIKVQHNSIWRPERNFNRGIRVGTGTENTQITHNLVHGQIQMEGGQAHLGQNLTGRIDGYFIDPGSGNLTLTAAATGAKNKFVPLPDVLNDFTGEIRAGQRTLGALESKSGSNSPFTFRAYDANSLEIWEKDRPVLAYNHGLIKGPTGSDAASHSAYIHPLYGLDGETLTGDFPKDHVYHRGLYWAWPHIKTGGEEVDLWSLRGIRIHFQEWLARETAAGHATLRLENAWFISGRKVMREVVAIRVHSAQGDARAIDLELAWTPLENPITLWGAPGKSYGGLTLRFAPRSETMITTPTGRAPEDLLMKKLPWADFTDAFRAPGKLSGAAIFVHPDHPDYPPEWMTRHYGLLAAGFPGVTAKTFPPNETFTCKYRIWVHRGAPDAAEIQKAYEAYR